MATKDSKPGLIQDDAAVEERVRQMMDPAVGDPKPTKTDEAGTAPEVAELPVPKEPLRIKILREGETATPVDTEPASASELALTDRGKHHTTSSVSGNPDVPPKEAAVTESDTDDLPEDPETAHAVEDIVRREGDELLEVSDKKAAVDTLPPGRQGLGHKLKAFFVDTWKNPRKRKVLIISLAVCIAVIGTVPTSRYFVLNSVGVRASARVHVLDESTLQPLRNVEVSIHGVSVRTNENGDARLEKIKLGPGRLKIIRRAFAPHARPVTIGWGSNPLGDEKLRPTGAQYAFVVTDLLSGKGIVKAEATSGEASAFSDETGKMLLTLDDPADELSIRITSEGRRPEQFKVDAAVMTERPVRMVPARKHAYLSRREGRYDVYAAYADGKEESLVLKGTGSERDDMVLVPHPTEDLVALVSTRGGTRNEDGYLLSTLTIVDLRTKSTETVQSSERIQLTGWFGDRLAYVRVVSGASAGDPKRNRLMAYHYKDDTNNELAASNYFNDIIAVGDRVYYAPSGAYQNGVNVSLFSIKPDGSERRVVLNKEVWNIFRTSYSQLILSAANEEWYELKLPGDKSAKLSGEPNHLTSRVFTAHSSSLQALWVDNRDGKGVLIAHDIKSGDNKTLRNQSGLKNPVSWLNDNTVVYRVKTDGETADYALSIDGGPPKKIADVTNTAGIDRWYYY